MKNPKWAVKFTEVDIWKNFLFGAAISCRLLQCSVVNHFFRFRLVTITRLFSVPATNTNLRYIWKYEVRDVRFVDMYRYTKINHAAVVHCWWFAGLKSLIIIGLLICLFYNQKFYGRHLSRKTGTNLSVFLSLHHLCISIIIKICLFHLGCLFWDNSWLIYITGIYS